MPGAAADALSCLRLTASHHVLTYTAPDAVAPASQLSPTWQSIASNSFALSLNAMISVGHTNVKSASRYIRKGESGGRCALGRSGELLMLLTDC